MEMKMMIFSVRLKILFGILSLLCLTQDISGSISAATKRTISLNIRFNKERIKSQEETSPSAQIFKSCACCCAKVFSRHIEGNCTHIFKCTSTEIKYMCSKCPRLKRNTALLKSNRKIRSTLTFGTKFSTQSVRALSAESKTIPQKAVAPSTHKTQTLRFSSQFDPKTNRSNSGFIPLPGRHRKSSNGMEWSKRTSARNHTNSHYGRPVIAKVTRKTLAKYGSIGDRTSKAKTASIEDRMVMVPLDMVRKNTNNQHVAKTTKSTSRRQSRKTGDIVDVKLEASKIFTASLEAEDYTEEEDISLERVVPAPKTKNYKTIEISEWMPFIPHQEFADESFEAFSFSTPYDPKRNTSSSGFVPISGPFGSKRKQFRREPYYLNHYGTARKEESRSSDILGDGNFEIITGGIFSDYEDNEIDRFSRSRYRHPEGRRKKFNPSRDFFFPSYFTEDLPSHQPFILPRSFKSF